MVVAICILILVYNFASSKYTEANGDSWYRNNYKK